MTSRLLNPQIGQVIVASVTSAATLGLTVSSSSPFPCERAADLSCPSSLGGSSGSLRSTSGSFWQSFDGYPTNEAGAPTGGYGKVRLAIPA